MSRPYLKMNGLGNDFVVVDATREPFAPRPDQIRQWSHRETGIGFDQLIAIEASPSADAFMRVWNADGSSVETCGNALRCVGKVLMDEGRHARVSIDTLGGPTFAFLAEGGQVSVDMGRPRLDWSDIPLAEAMDTRNIELQVGPIDAPLYHTPGAVSMGNPHVVFFVADIATVNVARTGSLIEHHPLFPEGVNVEFVQVLAPDHLRMRVWERGAGITRACGTGACASLVAASRRGLSARAAKVEMDGGPLWIDWREADDHVIMTGPASLDGSGVLS